MRYRDVSGIRDFSRDVAIVVDFIGQEEYRSSLEAIGKCLNMKGFVTPFDDALFALELDLFNLEKLREHWSGDFQSLPKQCHAGVDFLIGLGQTIPILSANAKTKLLARLKAGLKEGLWPLQHELRVAAMLSKLGWDVQFHDFEAGGGFDFLATRNEETFEVEAKAVSGFTGWPIKPEDLNKLLAEVKRHFIWDDDQTIPIIGLQLSSSLSPNRDQLLQLVSGFSEVARTRETLLLADAQIRFMGTSPNIKPEQLLVATRGHALATRKIILVNPTHPKLVLEVASKRPIQIERKIIKMVSETAKQQFSCLNPAVIWTHINLIPNEVFTLLSTSREGRACLFDRIASSALHSVKRRHLNQLVFSGGSFFRKTGSTARSSYGSAVYDSPECCFGQNFIFPGGRKSPSLRVESAS